MGYNEDLALLNAQVEQQMARIDTVKAGPGYVMARTGVTKVVGKAWGGAAPPPTDKHGNPMQLPTQQQHVCAWKECSRVLPYAGFCEEHAAIVQKQEVGPEQLKASVGGGNPNRPSAKNLKLINQGQNGDDMLTADARDWSRLARLTGEPGFEGPSSNQPVQQLVQKPEIRPAPLVGPDGMPISASVAAPPPLQAVPAAAPMPMPPPPAIQPSPAVLAAVPPPQPQVPDPRYGASLVTPAVVGGGGELRVAMSAYEALKTLSPEAQGRVLGQLAEMFGLRVVPAR